MSKTKKASSHVDTSQSGGNRSRSYKHLPGDRPAPKHTHRQEAPERTARDEYLAPQGQRAARERIFSLDIGTRSVIGIVAEQNDAGDLEIIATTRQEHKTRAMLDGQIHDVPQVAAVINDVK